MLIHKIELKNFRYVEEEELVTPKNETFILLGKNGSSKSTFIWAVPFCFYGFSDWTLENTLKWGKKEGYVKIYFQIKDKKYIAERSFDKKSSSFRLYQVIDGQLEELGGGLNKEAEEQFKKIFPVPKEVFLQVVTRVQTDNLDYQLGSFCGATPAKMYDHIKHFVEVVKIEKYEKVNSEIISELKEEKIKLESTIESAEKSIEDLELGEITEEDITEKEIEKKKLKDRLDELQEERSQTEKYLEKQDKWKKAQEVIEKLEGVEPYYERWQHLKTIEEPEEPYDEEKIEELQSEIKELENIIEGNKEEIEELESKADELKPKIEEQDDVIYDLMEKQNDYKQEKKSLEKQIKLMEKGKCPECERRFRSTDERIAEAEEELKELKGPFDVDSARDKKRELEKELTDTRRKIKEYRGDINVYKDNITKFNRRIDKAEASKEATEKWEEKKQFKENYPYNISPDKGFMKLENAREVEKPKSRDVRSMDKIKEEHQEVFGDHTKVSNALENMRSNKEKYEYYIKEIEENEEKYEQLKEKLDKHLKLSKIYSRTGAPHFMIKEFLHFLQHYSNQYLEKFTNGRISIKFKTNHNSKSKPIELIFYDANRNNKPRPYSTFSRGEKTRVALSVEFLGMGRVFGNLTNIDLKTGLIDEVYGLDEEGQKEFAEILTELSGIRPVMGGVVCFESMAHNFENIIKVEEGELIY